MAYENGYNIFDYCGPLFVEYCKDGMIFTKALQILENFERRYDFPFCIDELDKAIMAITGTSTASIFTCTDFVLSCDQTLIGWDPKDAVVYKDAAELAKNMNNSEELLRKFKNEFTAFAITIRPLVKKVMGYNNEPMGLKKVFFIENVGRFQSVIKFVRNDDETFDIFLSEREFIILKEALLKIGGSYTNE